VRGAPAHFLDAFTFRIEEGRILAFTDRMLRVRAEKA